MAAFKRCDQCGRTVAWSDLQERRTWLELHWDDLGEDNPEQVWDFCSWECLVGYGFGRRHAPASDLIHEVCDHLAASGIPEEEIIATLERERARRQSHQTTVQRDVRQLLEELERRSRTDWPSD